jgi:hypothetical protein
MFGHDEENNDNPVNIGAAAASDGTVQEPAIPSAVPPPISVNPGEADSPVTSEADLREALSPAGGFPIATSQKVQNGPTISDDTPESILAGVTDVPSVPKVNDDLASIKIQALDELYPLIDKLDLSPDERFRTIMMMIQASDNQDLIKAAYDSAHSIEDEKTKAQALLDIVNEINYFTQNPSKT